MVGIVFYICLLIFYDWNLDFYGIVCLVLLIGLIFGGI